MSKIDINRGNDNNISVSGVSYVVIPYDTGVADYVQKCYRNHTISIGGGYGGTYMHNVKVANGVLNKIQFPNNNSELGSSVVWIRDSFTNRPIVIGVLESGTSGMTGRYEQRVYQEVASKVVEMFLDAMNARVSISAVGDESTPGMVVVKATSGNGEGDVVKLVSKDLITAEGKTLRLSFSKDVNLLINDGENDILSIVGNDTEYHIKDNFGNEFIFNVENCQILTPKFNVGQGTEQMILGNTLVSLLGELIDAITNLTVLTHVGASGTPINAATFTDIKSRLETALSELSNTD
jgi:hypothetical protein